MAQTQDQAKELSLPNGELVRYFGDAVKGLSVHTTDGGLLTVTPERIRTVTAKFSGHNPLLDDPRVSSRPSLDRFVSWATSPESRLGISSDSRETAKRILLVFMGEGILGMCGHVQSPSPEDFPPAPAHECLTQLRGRRAVYVDRPFIAEVEVKDVSIETQAEDHEYATLTLLTRKTLASGSSQAPDEFTIGCEAEAATRRMGSLSAPYLSWQLVMAPSLVDDILDLAGTCKSNNDLLRTIRRML
jgi:hypothetical protein